MDFVLRRNSPTFFERTKFWMLEPNNDLVSDGYCLANPEREYVIYLPEEKAFTFKLEGIERPMSAQWFQPFTGKYVKAASLGNGEHDLYPPTELHGGPVVLHVKQGY